MKTIYKYEILLEDISFIELPVGAVILTVQNQHLKSSDRNIMQLWALVDTDNQVEKRQFHLYGTGHPILEDNLIYIGTFHDVAVSLVFHLFERGKIYE